MSWEEVSDLEITLHRVISRVNIEMQSALISKLRFWGDQRSLTNFWI